MSSNQSDNNFEKNVLQVPKIEEDEPLSKNRKKPTTKYLEEKDRWKHGVAYKVMCKCLWILAGIYILNLIAMWNVKDSLLDVTNNIIEILKTLLFTLSGFLFARAIEK